MDHDATAIDKNLDLHGAGGRLDWAGSSRARRE
jgi:hypothetical protein